MNATTPTLSFAIPGLSRQGDVEFCRHGQDSDNRQEEHPLMQPEDIAPAWAVSALTLAALVSLLMLAILG